MELRIGDQVDFLDEVGSGVVKDFKEGLVIVEDEHGFDIPCAPENLIIHRELSIDDLPEQPKEEEKSKKRKHSDGTFKIVSGKTPYLEMDLHLHELTDRESHMTDHEKIQLQLQYFDKALQSARDRRLGRVILIHGIGKGRLRSEIRKRLQNMPNCEFLDADYRQYGYGATEVRLWYN